MPPRSDDAGADKAPRSRPRLRPAPHGPPTAGLARLL